jgi:hypothetical protein
MNVRSLLLVAVVLMTTACVGGRTRETVLVTAVASAWPGVRADVVLGGGVLPATVELWDAAVAAGTSTAFAGLDWVPLEASGMAGVEERLRTGEIGLVGASVLRDRILWFGAGVAELVRGPLAYESSTSSTRETSRARSGPLVISRSSWARHPPSAIAGEVYR